MKIANRYAELPEKMWHQQLPNPLRQPSLVHVNSVLAERLQFPKYSPDAWLRFLNGEVMPDGFEPLAMVYAGHQFGHWAGQLGDGRGLLLAQVLDRSGQCRDLHLKGAGRTPYSRMGDGRAVLRSTIREYLAGHYLNALGVPSSDGLGLISSKHLVQRETVERGAMMLRVADSHIRLGHFEWVARFAPELLQVFTDFVIDVHYPECRATKASYQDFIYRVIERTAAAMAHWQLAGFAHGVMNTDNLSITGSVIDFGPYGFMERFEPDWINNHSDSYGRYVYRNQPAVGLWNLRVWCHHLSGLGLAGAAFDELLNAYEPIFQHTYEQGLMRKMGLCHSAEDVETGLDFLRLLESEKLDFTNSFRRLSYTYWQRLGDDCADKVAFNAFARRYSLAIARQNRVPAERLQTMQAINPVYTLRNSMAQKAIERAQCDDFSEVKRLFELLSQPFEQQAIATTGDISPPAKGEYGAAISCSS